MKVLHVILPDLKFIKGATSFINTYFEKEEHDILYVNNTGQSSLISSDIDNRQMEIFLKNKYDWISMRKLLCILRRYDFVLFHSLFLYQLLKIMLTFDKKVLKKMVWIAFGGDLYPSVEETVKDNRIRYRLHKRMTKYMVAFVGIFPLDCEYFKKIFPESKAKVYYAPYYGMKMPEEYKHYNSSSRLQETLRKKECIYILIGHSAVKAMGHIEVLDYLKKFSEQNIKLLIPLGYGNEEYAEEVQKHAEEIFKEKAVCFRYFMQSNDYFDLLKRVDIAIFNTYRQQGLGSVQRMIFRNAKIYMPENSVMYRYYRSKFVPINKTSELSECSFEELISLPVYENRDMCIEFIKSFGDMDLFINPWKKIYNELRRVSLNETK